MEKREVQVIFGTIFVVFILLLSFQYLFIKSVKEDYGSKITILNNNINTLNDNMDTKISDLTEGINSQNLIFNKKLNKIDEEQKQTDSDLLDLIQETQIESQQKLSELKTDLEGSISSISVENADFSAIVEDILLSVVSVATETSQGSGVFIRDGGYIVTNAHVIRGALQIAILTYDNQIFNTQLIGYDNENDIALLKINQDYDHLRITTSDDVRIGEKVIALGNPGGLDFSVTEGIVSAKRTIGGKLFIQTDVPISPGNSGGPLVNTKGRVIGLNNFKISGPGFEGLGFAIPSERINEVIDEIMDAYSNQQGQ